MSTRSRPVNGPRSRFRDAASRRAADERGVVIVWLVITLVVLLGVTALALDVGYWRLTQTREQRAADAAALAGAVNFPGDPTEANAAAVDIAGNNGYPVAAATPVSADDTCPLGGETTSVCVGAGAQPFQYKVTVSQEVQNMFGGIFGIGSTTVRATGTAEYLKPLSMGSPSNQFGNDPDSTSWPISGPSQTYPNFWANIAGGNSVKQNGDAYAADNCDVPTDGCSGIGSGDNLDYKANGYFYSVDFSGDATVNLQVFDPAFVDVGDFCTNNNLARRRAHSRRCPTIPRDRIRADWLQRYLPVTNQSNQQDPGYRYCTGDQLFGSGPPPDHDVHGAQGDGSRRPRHRATGVLGHVSRVQRRPCQRARYRAHGSRSAGSVGHVFPAVGNPLPRYRAGGRGVLHRDLDRPAERRSQPILATGRSRRRRSRTAGRRSPATPTWASTPTSAAVRRRSSTSPAFRARPPGTRSCSTSTTSATRPRRAQLQVVPPSDSNIVGDFDNCQWTGNSTSGALGYASNTPTAPWGPLTPIPNCLITGVNGGGGTVWNAQWSTVTIPIPNNYKCNDSDPQGCWLKINYLFGGGVNDTTSWNAYLLGDPVRLVQ